MFSRLNSYDYDRSCHLTTEIRCKNCWCSVHVHCVRTLYMQQKMIIRRSVEIRLRFMNAYPRYLAHREANLVSLPSRAARSGGREGLCGPPKSRRLQLRLHGGGRTYERKSESQRSLDFERRRGGGGGRRKVWGTNERSLSWAVSGRRFFKGVRKKTERKDFLSSSVVGIKTLFPQMFLPPPPRFCAGKEADSDRL